MADCEMCGKSGKLIKTKVEGTLMNLCSSCASYGEAVAPSKTMQTNFSRRAPKSRLNPDENKTLVKNLGMLVKQAREKKGLKQEQVAKALNEKESLIHHIESGKINPRFKTARKLEKFFGVRLIEEAPLESSDVPVSTTSTNEPLTMGDLLKKAMKK